MFNALTPVQLLSGIGQTLRMAAAAPALEEYQRSQLLAAYSVSRLLAAETAAASELLAWARAALLAALREDRRPPARRAAAAIVAAPDGPALGEAVAALLAALPPEDGTRAGVRAVLRELADREVRALDAPAA